MKKRQRINTRKSKKTFSRTARPSKRDIKADAKRMMMRGGYRL